MSLRAKMKKRTTAMTSRQVQAAVNTRSEPSLTKTVATLMAEFLDRELGKDSGDSRHGPTEMRLLSSLFDNISRIGNPREMGAAATVEKVIQLELDKALKDLILRFFYFLITKEYGYATPCSTLLVYFSGILGLSADGSTFERALNYTSKLSGFAPDCSSLSRSFLALLMTTWGGGGQRDPDMVNWSD